MARVRSTAGIVTVLDMSKGNPAIDPPDPDTLSLNVRLLAVLDNGQTVIDPAVQSTGMGIDRAQTSDLDGLTAHVTMALRLPQLPGGHRSAIWGGLVDELKGRGVETDPETLQALDFELLATKAVLDELGR